MKQSTEAAWKRAMKIQEVILRADGSTDHVVAGRRDHRHQLSTASPGALRII